ncbi:unnamed protein product [Paramecium primaurelia]|uniref:Importin N-terminal domain-containing protein n=1 Tax=Paramecium primaurelia TaxID=5886 RepID=A0A8S1KTI6_PARPR|nr:unnamed protein product [Paramecium primaurelia]
MAEVDYNTLVQASQLLFDHSQPFNDQKAVALDLVTSGMRSSNIQIITACNKIWVDLQNDQFFWTMTDQVILLCKQNQTKFLALKVLEEQIKTKWNLIREESRQGLKGFILKQLLHFGAKDQHDSIEESLLNQINMIIIQILKHEWKTTWVSFIPEICELSKTDQNLCENNLKLLRLLSQEIFDYSKNQLTTNQIVELKSNLHKEFQLIFELCFFLVQTFVEKQNIKITLIKQTLETLYTYLSWIPFGFIFMTQLCEILIQLFDNNHFRNLSIRCLTEIVILKLDSDQQKMIIQQQKIGIIFEKILIKLRQVFPCDFGFLGERQRLRITSNTQLQFFDDFCAILTQFFTGILSQHLDWLENVSKTNPNVIQLVDYSLQYLIGFSQLPLEQNYKVCAEFWFDFTKRLLEQPTQLPKGNQIILNLYSNEMNPPSLQNNSYPRILVELRKIVVSKMAKPQEVLISIDETGQPIKEELQNTENNALYDLLKDLLINLAKLNWTSTKEIITQKLDKQVKLHYSILKRINNGVLVNLLRYQK